MQTRSGYRWRYQGTLSSVGHMANKKLRCGRCLMGTGSSTDHRSSRMAIGISCRHRRWCMSGSEHCTECRLCLWSMCHRDMRRCTILHTVDRASDILYSWCHLCTESSGCCTLGTRPIRHRDTFLPGKANHIVPRTPRKATGKWCSMLRSHMSSSELCTAGKLCRLGMYLIKQ